MTAPKTSGIAAASGERKTSRRTSRRIGSAISSLRSAASIELVLDLPREGRVAGLDRRRPAAWTSAVEDPFSSSTESLTASARPTWKSAMISARRGLGPQALDRAAVPGREGGHGGVGGAQGVGPARAPGGRRPAAGPRSRIANGAVSPKCSRRIALAREDSVPGMSSEVGLSLLSTPVPEHGEDEQGRDCGEHRARMAQQEAGGPSAVLSPLSVPSPPRRHSW